MRCAGALGAVSGVAFVLLSVAESTLASWPAVDGDGTAAQTRTANLCRSAPALRLALTADDVVGSRLLTTTVLHSTDCRALSIVLSSACEISGE